MLVENQMIDIHITIRNIKYYQKQGYSDIVPNNILCVKAEDLPKESHYKVKVKCDYCGTIINVAYRDYCRFDFYLPKYNLCIEYDGEGHYKPINRGGFDENELQKQFEQILNRDNIKTDYCQKHNIDLLRIPYWEYDNVESIIKNKIFT